jgi:hypothetical protein
MTLNASLRSRIRRLEESNEPPYDRAEHMRRLWVELDAMSPEERAAHDAARMQACIAELSAPDRDDPVQRMRRSFARLHLADQL